MSKNSREKKLYGEHLLLERGGRGSHPTRHRMFKQRIHRGAYLHTLWHTHTCKHAHKHTAILVKFVDFGYVESMHVYVLFFRLTIARRVYRFPIPSIIGTGIVLFAIDWTNERLKSFCLAYLNTMIRIVHRLGLMNHIPLEYFILTTIYTRFLIHQILLFCN